LALQGHAEELRPLARSFIADRKSVVTENLYERAPAVANGRKKRLIWNVKSSKADQPSSEDRWESFRGFCRMIEDKAPLGSVDQQQTVSGSATFVTVVEIADLRNRDSANRLHGPFYPANPCPGTNVT